MMYKYLPLIVIGTLLLSSCTKRERTKLEEKGFRVDSPEASSEDDERDGLNLDTLLWETRPTEVLRTAHPEHRLTTIYKINYNKKTGKPFSGSNDFHYNYSYDGESEGNNWNGNFMPGFEAMAGYNLVNVSHYNVETDTSQNLFNSRVLIKTVYFPTYDKDTLNGEPIKRNFYMVSVYDEDTNKDGFINMRDLRRFYLFDIEGNKVKALVPPNCSVMSSEYDPGIDYMYIYARLDANKNGRMEVHEEMQVFWVDLKDPERCGSLYQETQSM